jgi:hypothetical protein
LTEGSGAFLTIFSCGLSGVFTGGGVSNFIILIVETILSSWAEDGVRKPSPGTLTNTKP